MLIASTVTVDAAAIRFENWQYGYAAGSRFASWSINPLEPATEFFPSSETTLHPVTITASIEGSSDTLIDNGWIDSVEDGVTDKGRVNSISGRDKTYRIFERGPLRDTIFVPRNIIEEVYPRGIRIFTLNGESVVGLAPDTEPRFSGTFGSTLRVEKKTITDTDFGFGTITIDPKTNSGKRRGPWLGQPTYDAITEVEFVAEGSDDCIEDFRRGPMNEWVESVPPLIVIFGGRGLGNDDGRIISRTAGSGSGNDQDTASSLSKFRAGGVDGASTNLLVKIIATKAGFARIRINTPDMAMFEPLQVSAGSTWISAVETLVGPWNPMIFATREPDPDNPSVLRDVLNVFDVEATDIDSPKVTVGPDSASVIRKSIARIPPYKNLDIIGTLRRGLRKRVPMPATENVRDPIENDVPHIGPHTELPYIHEIRETHLPSSLAAATIFPGEDAVNWTHMNCVKRLYVDPEAAQVSLVYSEDELYDSTGLLSRRIFELEQHLFDDLPHGSIETEYGRVAIPQSGGQSNFELIRRVTTRFDDCTEVEGVFAQHVLVEGLVAFSMQNDQRYKAIPYWDAAASGTVDISAQSIDSVQFAKIQERREEYQMLDAHVARKRTWEIDYLGDRPPRYNDEFFGVRHRYYGGGYDPRQRFCFPIDEVDGEGTKSIAALWAATQKQAELIRDRAKRRGGQRHEEVVVQLNTYLPKLRPAIPIRLEATPIRTLDQANLAMSTINVISGDYFLAGFMYQMQHLGKGAARIDTILYLRSRW